MPRPKRILQALYPYHVVARTNNREKFPLPMGDIWRIYAKRLRYVAENYQVKTISFVLMSNHFHFIALTPNSNLDRAMAHLMRETSRSIAAGSVRKNHIYGGRYRASILSNESAIAHAYRYVFQNPVNAGICSRVELHPYSTLRFFLSDRAEFPVDNSFHFNRQVVENPEIALRWLNLPETSEERNLVSRALKHYEFRISKSNTDAVTRRRLAQKVPQKVPGTFWG